MTQKYQARLCTYDPEVVEHTADRQTFMLFFRLKGTLLSGSRVQQPLIYDSKKVG